MSQKDKLIAKIKNNHRDVELEEIHKYLVMHGAQWHEGGKGSHRVYLLNGSQLTIPRKKPIKAIYVKLAIELVEVNNEQL